MKKVLVIGEPLIRITPVKQQQLHNGVTAQVYYGGSEINVACQLSGLGTPCRVFTALPQTAVGQSFEQFLATHHIDTQHIAFIGNRIGVYYLEEGFGIRQSQVYYDREQTSMTQLEHKHIHIDKLLNHIHHVHVSGITLALSETIQNWVESLLLHAREKHISVSLDLNWRSKLISLQKAKLLFSKFAQLADYCFGIDPLMIHHNDTALFKRQDATVQDIQQRMEAVKDYFNLKAVFHTERLQKNGIQQYNAYGYSNKLYVSKTYRTQVLERIGSGDAFVAGALYHLLKESNMQTVIDFACASGSYKCTMPGDNMSQSVEVINHVMNGGHDVIR